MSDYAEILVFDTDAAPQLRDRLFTWLVEQRIIESKTSRVSGEPGHRPGASAKRTSLDPDNIGGASFASRPEGELYFSPEGDHWVTCPTCRRPLEDEALGALENESSSGPASANCRGCGEAWSLRQWVGHGCAFGTLAIFFWDWSLRDEFIDEVQAWTGVPLVRIQYHL